LTKSTFMSILPCDAGVAELADARDSNSREGDLLWVRFPPPALYLDYTSLYGFSQVWALLCQGAGPWYGE
jgi:hypothetical protein